MKLMEEFLGKQYCLYADNFNNSAALTKQAGINETYAFGILRAEHRGNPKEVLKAKKRRIDTKKQV